MSPVPDPGENGQKIPVEEESVSFHNTFNQHTSSGEEDANPSDAEYVLLPQDPDDCINSADEAGVDYSSVSSLMAALNEHGPMVIDEPASNDDGAAATETDPSLEIHSPQSDLYRRPPGSHLLQEPRRDELRREQSELWNTMSNDRLSLDKTKEEEIKSVMANFSLPPSSIPPWASNVSDEDLHVILKTKLSHKCSKPDKSLDVDR